MVPATILSLAIQHNALLFSDPKSQLRANMAGWAALDIVSATPGWKATWYGWNEDEENEVIMIIDGVGNPLEVETRTSRL
ncbi:hypothetical protein BDV95DRAFT_607281 [Massariosphaeria phaeospora]|uniref:Uncharacterized protein n=1 Tax=Massariosphaeria phaeospora TaxID=100035 RepID=A0A7C8I506_9PLEO|nr:hypothetical protein BDV95DRAFT_607281 [Massariosphaeria phaeospora]